MAKVKERVARSPLDLKVFKKFPYESDWMFRQRLSVMSEHASDIGEILYLASKIDPKDGESWIKEWADLGERLEKQAESCLAGGAQGQRSRIIFARMELLPGRRIWMCAFPSPLP
uniref:Uncharacterized protein n=1 Tax=Candidatus Methanophagaceae archaeon ANME-1 ERB6 TaxID=2759912 RepID=A0A7G9YTS8_9EURY|nr:hypothetical protein PFCPEAIJ_00014 [Methanosarcinales archaeon ANME-1 ERB6]